MPELTETETHVLALFRRTLRDRRPSRRSTALRGTVEDVGLLWRDLMRARRPDLE
jgi:hypothetical protein